ncbi:threonine/homoserine/homoserine lactone efflux protein [Paenibacillus amylolyticus]|uniref:Threonine/homoserine/homoserine lactone efflux protein n=1 Tax=Paenibacillus amylolyticus TaxID=1451 RepID=A0AAP5LQX9_PAEAM|nr:LysE family transporter [Paenibacillus amylolyticus]MDR6723904.1 threonine/homoserine/homoserine lactone efflux protein [Paenibacillus amylolyticus]
MFIIPLLIYAIVSSFSPGPNNIIAMTSGRDHGFSKTLPFIGGVALSCMIIMLLSSYFSLMLHQFIPTVRPILNLLGCMYMLYLAVKVMLSHSKKNNALRTSSYSFSFGCVLQFINPKVIIYGLTAISMFVIPLGQSHPHLILFSLLLTLIGISANMTWALCGSLFQNLLLRHQRLFNVLMGIMLIYSAVSILVSK